MTTRFDGIDLSQLPAPEVIETLDYEAILAELVADFIDRFPDYDVDGLESDPAKKVLETAAWRELHLRQRVNDAARAVMLASALGGDLEHLGALYKVARAPAEADERYRARVQLAPEALSTAGPIGAYEMHAMSAVPTIKQVRVLTPNQGSGQVHVLPLMGTGNGQPSTTVLDAVRARLSAADVRPLTDILVVRAPAITAYTAALTIRIKRGPDLNLIRSRALAAVEKYVASRHRIGETVYLAGIVAAAKLDAVETVVVASPVADLVPAADQAFHCSAVTVAAEVI